MNKGKEWLKNQIEIMGSKTSENYPHERMVDREVVLNLIDQLDEPVKVVIPQFVADWIETTKKYSRAISALMNYENIKKESHKLDLWCFESGNDDNLHNLAKAWLDGYEIEKEKEKLYYIELIKGKRLMAQVAGGACWFPYGRKDVLSGVDKIEFTESEIKTIDERFWPFAVEVAE